MITCGQQPACATPPLPVDNNPYSPSKANLRDQPPQAGSPLKAVAVGFVVDLGGTIAASIIIGIAYGLYAASGASTSDTATAPLNWPNWLSTTASMIGLGFSVLGGYCCARIVQRDEYRWGGVLAACVFVAGLLLGSGESAAEEDLFLGAVSVMGTMVGAHFGRTRQPPTSPAEKKTPL
jgi:hypothetical protein